MKMKAYQTDTGYLIQIGNSVFEMSITANQPNGVNMFFGDIGRDLPLDWYRGYKRTVCKNLPDGVKEGIKQRGGLV